MLRKYIPIFGMIGLTMGLGLIGFYATTDLNVVRYIKQGYAKGLATCFDDNIEIELPNGAIIEGKEQCEETMNEFFKSYPPLEFTIIHRGKGNDNSKKYYIGNYKSNIDDFRMTIMLDNMVVDNIIIDDEDVRVSQTY